MYVDSLAVDNDAFFNRCVASVGVAEIDDKVSYPLVLASSVGGLNPARAFNISFL